MLQLKHLEYLHRMTGVPVSEILPLSFGYEINWTSAQEYLLASQFVPDNVFLMVLRVQTYLVNIDNTATDFQFYRTIPSGNAWWKITADAGATVVREDYTNPNAPAQLALDTDCLLLFPQNFYATLAFDIANAAPTGTWRVRTTCFGYFVPPKVSDFFGGPQQWISVQ